MSSPAVAIVKCYAFTLAGGRGGHISLTKDGRAVLVHLRHTDAQLELLLFSGGSEETAEVQAQRHVREKIDPKAVFFEDPFLDLITWLLQNH